jgi:hypothetical protein
VAVEEVEEDALLLESDSGFMAANRSCINFPSACRGSSVELVELVDEVELSEVEFPLEFGGGPLGGGGIESPIWLNACMMLCINVSFAPEFDRLPETRVSELAPLLFDCASMER